MSDHYSVLLDVERQGQRAKELKHEEADQGKALTKAVDAFDKHAFTLEDMTLCPYVQAHDYIVKDLLRALQSLEQGQEDLSTELEMFKRAAHFRSQE